MKIPAAILAFAALSHADKGSSAPQIPAQASRPLAVSQNPQGGLEVPQGPPLAVQNRQGPPPPSQGRQSNHLTGPDGAPLELAYNIGEFAPILPLKEPLSQFTQPPLLSSQRLLNNGLIPGDVFGLVTRSGNPTFNNETVVIYHDGTLGINEPNSPGYLFEGTLLPEYKLLMVPEPLATVKLNHQNVFFVNDSLYNPEPIFTSKGWTLLVDNQRTVVCPSWNSVLVSVDNNGPAPCSDAVDVTLGIVPVTI